MNSHFHQFRTHRRAKDKRASICSLNDILVNTLVQKSPSIYERGLCPSCLILCLSELASITFAFNN